MPYRLFDFSSDQGVEGEGLTLAEAFVQLGRAVAHVLTDGSKVGTKVKHRVDVEGAPDLPGTAVAFVNDLVYRFDVDQFLLGAGELEIEKRPDGIHRVTGTLRGDTFDPKRHAAGRGVKAATYHDATYESTRRRHRLRVILDL
ncbi:MAG TPA: archease [Candidatus Thermoplasmatota archaeon]|nr:archease [Candidatus Thermoplasmatota archaeon]